jgi:hypothetical protein
MSEVNIADGDINTRAMKGWNDWLAAWLGAVSKAWTDPTFKALLLEDARAALKQLDYELPEVLEVKVVEIVHERDGRKIPVSDHSPYVFTPGIKLPKQTLVIGLFPPPADLGEGLITLANHAGLSTSQCFCGCS